MKVGGPDRERERHRRVADDPHDRFVSRRRRRCEEHREPAAEWPSVRQPRADDPWRGPRLPLAIPTKSTQFSPQIAGGNGRNVNYQIDGGDNNDDTVGGLLQLFPLEAIQEFNFVTQRYKAEYGRSNGGVMNIVTKSGTNNFAGSGFLNFRDKSMNAATVHREAATRRREAGLSPLPVRRVVRWTDRPEPGPLLRRRERTQQDTLQIGRHQRFVPGARRRLQPRRIARTC